MAAQASLSPGCFIGDVRVDGAPTGPLQGLTVAIKDSYDIAGHRTSNGSPVWRESHPPATSTAPAVQALLDAGATVIGKTIMDEMAYSLQGENPYYGNPVNGACPDRFTGGSSSGSASAVSCGVADFALGGDTGGSVRVPASFCGLFGIRPTHGRVDISGSCPLAPSFDTGGWFARDPALLHSVGSVLLQKHTSRPVTFKRWLVGTDAFKLANEDTGKAIYDALSSKFDQVKAVLGSDPGEGPIGEGEAARAAGLPQAGLPGWIDVFVAHQAYEAWQAHGPWLTQSKPNLGPGVKDRFKLASTVTHEAFLAAQEQRRKITAHVEALLGSDGVLTIPTTVGPSLPLTASDDDKDTFRRRLLSLTSIAGLTGLPEVTLPVARVHGCPVGMSLIGPRGSDEALMELAVQLAHALDIKVGVSGDFA